MLFGFCNAPAAFQRLINLTFAEMINQFVIVYLDDILVYSETEEEHLAHLRKVTGRTESLSHTECRKSVSLKGQRSYIWATR